MHGPTASTPLRTRIYIDGYNLYYGCLRNTAFKWLDPIALCEQHILPSILAPDDLLRPRSWVLLPAPSLKFFTARIIESVASDPDSVSSQARYHSALRKLHGTRIELIEGYYAVNPMKVRLICATQPKRLPKDCDTGLAWKVEEKQSDVNLALHAYHDALTGTVDQVVVVTNDTDLAPALEMIRANTSVRVGLVIPTTGHHRHPNSELVKLAHWVRKRIDTRELAASQLPRVIAGGRQATLKPESWYANPQRLKQVLGPVIDAKGSRGAAFKWMEAPNPFLGGRPPMELLETEQGTEKILSYINDWRSRREPAQEP
ncbi:DUF2384 domain-containing protein [Pseudomonas sp. App30]|uniref:antitoxin Xre/MbcA/ParS toxin-binding domain-containing protein n=1 Tax=Pseudomonas sp. App30 TaxID=3068990 RepID=UPI003A807DF8